MDTKVELVNGLTLSDPFIIASSHWTSTEGAFRQLAKVAPSAVTLKTTSDRFGGDGLNTDGKNRIMKRLYSSLNNVIANFSDGPKQLEFLDIFTTHKMTRTARSILSENCKLGLSVLQNEDYAKIYKSLTISDYDYIELNYKFSFRPITKFIEGDLNEIINDFIKFRDIFSDLPVFIKLSREASALFGTDKFNDILKCVQEMHAGMIVANSKKCLVPASLFQEKEPEELDGVVVGEYLFLDTYNMIKTLKNDSKDDNLLPPIIASGGATSISQIIDLLAAGADAVQLCTIFDIFGEQVLLWLREQLCKLCERFEGYENLITEIRVNSSSYSQAAKISKQYEFDQNKIVEDALKDSKKIFEIFENSIAGESLREKEIVEISSAREIPADLQFIVTTGNVSSYLLSKLCVVKYGLTSYQYTSTSAFLRELGNGTVDYDFAIIPESSLSNMENQSKLKEIVNFPERIMVVSRSVYELVGKNGKSLQDIDTIYHFHGTSSRRALGALLQEHHPPNFELIKTRKKLLPLFQFWNDSSAILIKPPLSRIYGLLGRWESNEEWNVIWTTAEDLILVASRSFIEKNRANDILDRVVNNIKLEMKACAENPNKKAQELLNFGFLGLCQDLLIS